MNELTRFFAVALLLSLGSSLSLGLAQGSEGEHDHSHHDSHQDSEVQRAATDGGTFPGVQGELIDLDLADYEGKVVVLTTLAGWCVGCFTEVPSFVALHNDYADSGVVVVGIMTQSAPEWTETFVARYKVSYPIYLDMSGSAAVERFGPQVVPTAMMIYDREGELVESLGGFDADKLRPILDGLL